MILGLFFMDATSFGEEDVPMLVTLQPIGFLLGILIVGPFYNSRPTPRSRIKTINRLYGISIISVLVISLASMWAQSTLKTCVLGCAVFLGSFGVAVQYFIVSEVFAIEFGENAAGLCVSLMDGFGHALSAIIFIPIGIIADGKHGWSGVWLLLAILLLFGCTLMNIFFRLFYLNEKKYSSLATADEL
jgi:MFS family permease